MELQASTPQSEPVFDAAFMVQFEQLLRWRRDVRHFLKRPVEPAVIQKLLALSCLSPSVGNSQPWRYVLVETPTHREAVRRNFEQCNETALNCYEGEQAAQYARLKLAGLQEAPIHLAVFMDKDTQRGHGLGKHTMPETSLYSVMMAIHTFWLSARAHGLGVGWVSILEPEFICQTLTLPDTYQLVAYLCVGYPQAHSDIPELEQVGWQLRDDYQKFIIYR